MLTVPASFDEEARELTVQAAQEAGLERVTLLEEPAAAFYAWIAGHLARSNKELFDGQTVLVCDVGGGTSDFTLVRVDREGDRVEFTRTTVGRHLLLGGDNLDLTISWLAESKLGKTLSLRQRSALRRQCSAAKETLLAPNGPAYCRCDRGWRRCFADRWHHEGIDHERRGSGTGAGRISAAVSTYGQAAAGKAERISRAGTALRLGPGDHAASGPIFSALRRRLSVGSTPSYLMAAFSYPRCSGNASRMLSSTGSAGGRLCSKTRIWILP